MQNNLAYVWYIEPQLAVGGGWASMGSWQYRYGNTQGGCATIEAALKAVSVLCPNIRVGEKQPITETSAGPVVGREEGFGLSESDALRSRALRLITDVLGDLGAVSFCHGEPQPWVIQFPGNDGHRGSRYRFATPGGALDMAHFERRCKKGER